MIDKNTSIIVLGRLLIRNNMIFFKKLYLFVVIIKYKIPIYNKLIYYLFCLSNNIYIKEITKNTHLYLSLKIF